MKTVENHWFTEQWTSQGWASTLSHGPDHSHFSLGCLELSLLPQNQRLVLSPQHSWWGSWEKRQLWLQITLGVADSWDLGREDPWNSGVRKEWTPANLVRVRRSRGRGLPLIFPCLCYLSLSLQVSLLPAPKSGSFSLQCHLLLLISISVAPWETNQSHFIPSLFLSLKLKHKWH